VGDLLERADAVNRTIRISSLAMRFYSHDGWTREDLEKYADGPIEEKGAGGWDHYWIPGAYTKLDVERLYEEEKPEVAGSAQYGELKGLSPLEILKVRNS
jgi:hypothetical protein